MPDPGATRRRAHAHADRFNAAVASGDWRAFAAGFAPDASMTFVDVAVPVARGRDAIVAAYEAQPPDETLQVLDAVADGGTDVLRFRWTGGELGTMRIRWAGGLVAELEVGIG